MLFIWATFFFFNEPFPLWGVCAWHLRDITYNYHDSLLAHLIEGMGHYSIKNIFVQGVIRWISLAFNVYVYKLKYFSNDKYIKMMNFKLGNEMWKVNWWTWHECGTKKKSESPTGIEPMTSQTLSGHSIHWAKRTHGEQENCDKKC